VGVWFGLASRTMPWGFDQVQNLVLYLPKHEMDALHANVNSLSRRLGQLRNLKTIPVPYVNFGRTTKLWDYNSNTVVRIQEDWTTRQEEFMRLLGQEEELKPPVVKFMVPQDMYVQYRLNHL
jgi:hypothetical protein